MSSLHTAISATLIKAVGAPPQERMRGTVSGALGEGRYIVQTAAGKLTVQLAEGTLQSQSPVLISRKGEALTIEPLIRNPTPSSGPHAAEDLMLSGSAQADADVLKQTAQLLDELLPSPPAAYPDHTVRLEALQTQLHTLSTPLQPTLSQCLGEVQKILESGSLTIQPLTPQQQQIVKQCQELLSAFIQTLQSPPSSLSSVTLAVPVQPGLIYFESAAIAQEWLQTLPPQAAALNTLLGSLDDGPLLLHLLELSPQLSRIALLSPAQACAELHHLLSEEMSHPLLKSLDANQLVEMTRIFGALDTQQLRELDSLLGPPSSMPRYAVTTPQQRATEILQWITPLLQGEMSAQTLAARPPFQMSTDIAAALPLLEQMVSATSNPAPVLLPLDHSIQSRDWLSQMVTHMGLDYEHRLSANPAASAQSMSETLKGRILELVQHISNEGALHESDSAEHSETIVHSALQEIAAPLAHLQHELSHHSISSTNTGAVVEKLAASIQSISVNLDQLATQLLSAQPVSPQQLIEQTATTTVFYLERVLNELVGKLPAQMLNEADGEAKPLFGHQPERIRNRLEQLVRATIESIQTNANRVIGLLAESASQGIGHSIENLLNRFESLQFLARQTPLPEGQQQILSIPVRMDNQLTDMTIRLVHHRESRRSGKSKESGRYSVCIDVAPSFAGPCSIQMDYVLRQNVQINLRLEREATREWFNEHLGGLRTVLSNLGLPNVTLRVSPLTSASALPPDHFPSLGSSIKGTSSHFDVHG